MQGARLGEASTDGERLFATAVDLVSSGSRSFKRTARRFSLCSEDAEDAYQRGLEILLTKAPTEERSELRRWLHTVIKHEALALRRQRERLLGSAATESSPATTPGPEEGSPERERGRRTAEALGHLKPSEIQCLLLKALGYSYDEIATRTGYSWTKVNRSLTEGRRRFLTRFDQIESGRRCRSLEPILSNLCDGEASGEQEQAVRAHLRSCSACRAALRSYRTAPARLAELIPPALALPSLVRSNWWTRLHDLVAVGAGERVGAAGYKVQQAVDLASAQKAAVVVASTAALAGGAVTSERVVDRDPRGSRVEARAHRDSAQERDGDSATAASVPVAQPPAATAPKPDPKPEENADAGGDEFSPEGGPAPQAQVTSARAASGDAEASRTEAAPGSFESGGGESARAAGGGGSGGEFGP